MKRKFIVISVAVFSIAIIGFSCKKKGKRNPEACNGKIRREVKIMTDAEANQIDTAVTETTIEALGELDVPEVKKETTRQPVEMKVYRVYCLVDKVKRERDGDFHIRLKSGDNYLIAESVNPECDYAADSPFLAQYRTVREFINSNDLEGKYVYVTGVAFVDIDHGYKRKQAKNNIELHPVLDIHF